MLFLLEHYSSKFSIEGLRNAIKLFKGEKDNDALLKSFTYSKEPIPDYVKEFLIYTLVSQKVEVDADDIKDYAYKLGIDYPIPLDYNFYEYQLAYMNIAIMNMCYDCNDVLIEKLAEVVKEVREYEPELIHLGPVSNPDSYMIGALRGINTRTEDRTVPFGYKLARIRYLIDIITQADPEDINPEIKTLAVKVLDKLHEGASPKDYSFLIQMKDKLQVSREHYSTKLPKVLHDVLESIEAETAQVALVVLSTSVAKQTQTGDLLVKYLFNTKDYLEARADNNLLYTPDADLADIALTALELELAGKKAELASIAKTALTLMELITLLPSQEDLLVIFDSTYNLLIQIEGEDLESVELKSYVDYADTLTVQ